MRPAPRHCPAYVKSTVIEAISTKEIDEGTNVFDMMQGYATAMASVEGVIC